MDFAKNMILKITNIGILGMDGQEFIRDFRPESSEMKDQRVTRELLKDYFYKFGSIRHVDYRAGQTTATVRFSDRDNEPDVCKKVIEEHAEKPLELGGQVVKMEIVTGEEEEEIYKSIISKGQARRDMDRGGYERRGGYQDRGDRGGRGGYEDRGNRGGYGGRGGYQDRGDRGDRNYDDRNAGGRSYDRRPRDNNREERDYQ